MDGEGYEAMGGWLKRNEYLVYIYMVSTVPHFFSLCLHLAIKGGFRSEGCPGINGAPSLFSGKSAAERRLDNAACGVPSTVRTRQCTAALNVLDPL